MNPDATATRARIVEQVCERIASGESVSKIFASPNPDFPSVATFWRWLHADRALVAIYDRATEQRGELYAEEIIDITDETPPQVNGAFGTHIDSAWVQWNKNRAEARKWVAARMRPMRYGDRTILAGDADNPITFDDPKAAILGRLNAGATVAGATGNPGEPEQ